MEAENNFNTRRLFASIPDQELSSFAGIFIPGGHASLTDVEGNARALSANSLVNTSRTMQAQISCHISQLILDSMIFFEPDVANTLYE